MFRRPLPVFALFAVLLVSAGALPGAASGSPAASADQSPASGMAPSSGPETSIESPVGAGPETLFPSPAPSAEVAPDDVSALIPYGTDRLSAYDLANRAFVLEDYGRALELFQQVLLDQNLTAWHDHALFLLARTYALLGEWPNAQMAVDNLIINYPKSNLQDDALLLVGNHFAAETPDKDISRAMRQFRLIMLRYPGEDKVNQATFRLGELAAEAGEWTEAISAFSGLVARKLEGKPDYEARFALAEAYRNPRNMQRDLVKALSLYEEIAKLHPELADSPQHLFAVANCQRDLKRPEEAIASLEQLLKKYPNSLFASVANPILAKCYEERRQNLTSQLVTLLRNSSKADNRPQPDPDQARAFIEQLLKSQATPTTPSPSPATEGQKLAITADREDGSHWKGNVRVVMDGAVQVLADEASYDRENQRLVATGNVRLTNGELLEAKGGAMTYNLKVSTAEMSRNVRVRRPGREDVTGDHIVVSLIDNEITSPNLALATP